MADFLEAGVFLALGVWWLISTLLLKLGKLKPGSRWAAGGIGTPLGQSVMAIGVLGLGLSELEDAFVQAAVLEYGFPILAHVVIRIMMVGFFVGIGIELIAYLRRKGKGPVGE